jgi:hypothetical protein
MIGYRKKIQGTINFDPPCGFTFCVNRKKWDLTTPGIVMGILWRCAGADSGGIKGETSVNMQVTEQCCAIFVVLIAAS